MKHDLPQIRINGEVVDVHGLTFQYIDGSVIGVQDDSRFVVPTGHVGLTIALVVDGNVESVDSITVESENFTIRDDAHDLHVTRWYDPRLGSTHIFALTVDPEVTRAT